MCSEKVLVDTCFLHKISNDAKDICNLKKILDNFKKEPFVHPYVAQHELSLNSNLQRLIDDGYIQVVKYEELFKKDYVKNMYKGFFETLYTDLRKTLESDHSEKAHKMYKSLDEVDIFQDHKQGSSLADVHMMLLAYFMKMPIVLTEDSDIQILRDIANRRLQFNGQELIIYDALDVVKQIASDPSVPVTSKDLEDMLNVMKERSHRTEIKQIWKDSRNAD